MSELSPTAQAVLDATFDYWPGGRNHPHKRVCIAAALRAVADQIGPKETLPFGHISYSAPVEEWHYQFKLQAKNKLLAIADELENHQ